MRSTWFFGAAAVAMAAVAGPVPAVRAQEIAKVGLILPMTGPFASTGKQISAAVSLYLQEHGDMVAGKKIEIILKDDAGSAEITKRLAQELAVNDKVAFLAGFGLTPLALATAPVATQAKVPEIVTAAATASITEASPFIVRTSFTLPQACVPIAKWAGVHSIKTVVTIVSDYGPGLDAEKWFTAEFAKTGGKAENIRVPLRNPDFAPFLQKAADQKPDAVFVFVPSGVGAAFMKQFRERGLDKTGMKLIGTGDVTDDDILNEIGDAALGATTSHHYSAAHDSPENKAFVAAFKKSTGGMRPNFMAVSGYDTMRLIFTALEKTGGNTDGAALVAAMKGASWVSPRGPITIDPETREVVQNIYIREVKRVGGELYNVEFETVTQMKDPAKQ